MDSDDERRRANEQLVATFFHQSRADAKARKRDKPKGGGPMHHRANTDWWNFGGKG
ncbi:hypothetical protein [Sphingobium sp. Z007]|uniref:hypothetical protein n=1 Tax=Sphingobium sp. Z007 TaxID=627495 RepID=UPI0015963588|nr:hypothetical protein [Sphingobium sp. Z007]